MAMHTNPLEHVRVAAPCRADWNAMAGTNQVRFCGQCSQNVYNLSGMTKREAEALITNAEGRLCIRYYQRADGSILTQNCPVGLRALKRRLSGIARAMVSAVLTFLAGVGLYTGFRRTPQPLTHLQGAMVANPAGVKTPPVNHPVLMGDMTASPTIEPRWTKGELLIVEPVVGKMAVKR